MDYKLSNYEKTDNNESRAQLSVETGPQNKGKHQKPCITKLCFSKRARPEVALDNDDINSKKLKLDNKNQEDFYVQVPVKNTANTANTTDCNYVDSDKSTTGITGTETQESDGETNSDDDIQGKIITTISSVSKPPTRPEAATFSKLYRLLRDGESINEGLEAKDPNVFVNVATHVAKGSQGIASQYISTCATLSAAKLLRLEKNLSQYGNGTKDIVEIDVGQLPMSVTIIDLTTKEKRYPLELPNYKKNKKKNAKFHAYASKYDEVLLKGKVPPNCLKLIENDDD